MTKTIFRFMAIFLSFFIWLAGCSQTKALVPNVGHETNSGVTVSDVNNSVGMKNPYTPSEFSSSYNQQGIEPAAAVIASDSHPVSSTDNDRKEIAGEKTEAPSEEISAGQGEKLSVADSSAEAPAEEAGEESPQNLMDTALEFYEASQEFWMQGNLDKAMEALDQAYELILKVEVDSDPELIQQKDDLRFMLSRRILEIYASRYTAVSGNHKAIPLIMNKHVEREIKLFLTREKDFFMESYKRSGKYRDMMVKALKEAGMPEELSWLPLIESGFKVSAFSRARALGLWQFIPSTGYKFGLARDTWVDERFDPEKSTKSAIAYMGELHKIFGDWITVLAAYNCGEGSVLRVIRSQRINYLDNFWDLYERLPRETARYVPRFLAVLHILKDPDKYGISLPEPDAPIPYETVTINKQVRLKDVAKKLGVSLKELVGLNPELRHRSTPNRDYSLRVPPGKGEVLLASIDDIPKWSPPRRAYTYHRVRRGQTLSYLAARYRTSVSAIARANNISRRSIIRVGQRLKIPIGRWYSRNVGSYSLLPGGKYRVRRGDSLWLIAKRFHTYVGTLKRRNNLSSNSLRVGQLLQITNPAKVASNKGAKLSGGRYRVKKGDTLWMIAEKFNTDTGTLKRLNGLKSSNLKIGQVIKITN